MIFDDHDVLDDWNTSRAWRDEMQATSWWEERITGALSSYWVYQHLGNLSPAGLEADETYARVRAARRRRGRPARVRPGRGPRGRRRQGALWSYRRDFGGRAAPGHRLARGRILQGDKRLMVGEREFAWIEEQVADGRTTTSSSGRPSRGCCRGRCTTSSPRTRRSATAAAGGSSRVSPSTSAGRGPRALGRLRRFVRAARPAHRPDRLGRGRHARAGNHLRPLRGCPPHVRQRGGLPAPHAITRLPAHLLTDAQRDPARDAGGVQGRLEPVRLAADPVPCPVRAGDARDHRLDDDGRPVLRQPRRVPALRRADGGVRAPEVRVRGRGDARQARPGGLPQPDRWTAAKGPGHGDAADDDS